jgi:uncharacterized membrane protein YqaE (UPF0057 family)
MKEVNTLTLILAIFLPPIGALRQVGTTKHFFINVLLTIFAVFPGSIHAVWLVLTEKHG